MTSEYVTIGHPDRMADFISEFLLDKYISKDPYTRYAVEVQVKDNDVTLAGEVTSQADFDNGEITEIVKQSIREIGYTDEYAEIWHGHSINPGKVNCTVKIGRQSPDISQGVDNKGWGDQGIFWGYAYNDPETDYMPHDWWMARRIGEILYKRRYGGLDIKTQVTVENKKITNVVVAIPLLQKHETTGIGSVENLVKSLCGSDVRVIVNGTGRYQTHSSIGDCGTTGRKLAVDFYGGNARIGGGSPWTKDPTKADLTLNLYARKLAKNYVKTTGIEECHVQIFACIGRREIFIQFFDKNMNLLESRHESRTNAEIIDELDLRKPIYAELCKNGLFSRI